MVSMARIMADAISSEAGFIPGNAGVIAGYDTGTPDIRWTAANWAQFPGKLHVHIDQGGIGAPAYSATVIDVETGAWPASAVPGWIARCTAPRPTVYCNRSTLPAVLATGHAYEIWLAFPGWTVGQPLPPVPAGSAIVAVQAVFGSAYDLSYVLDPAWPAREETAVTPYVIPGVPGTWISHRADVNYVTGEVVITGNGTDGTVWQTRFTGGAWTAPVPV